MPPRSPHALWYAHVVPAMIPVALLGSTVYIALQLVQTHLARERFLDGAAARVCALERELDALRARPPALQPQPQPAPPKPRAWWPR